MKKPISIILTVFILVALCACGEGTEPISYSIGEMQFTLDSALTLDKESDAEKNSYKENQVYAYKTFTGNDYDLTATATLTSMDNDAVSEYIENYIDETIDLNGLEDVSVAGAMGKITSYTDDDKEICVLYVLKDGLFYSFEATVKSDKDTVKDALVAIARSIKYDASLMGTQTVKCGDLQYKISKKFAALDFDTVPTSYDEQWFATASDSYIEFGSLYSIDWENGYDMNSNIYMLTAELENSEQTSEEGKLGTYNYITGKDAAGYNHIITMFKYQDKSYCFNLFSKKEMSKDDIKPILDSITVANNSDDTDASDSTDSSDQL